MHTRPSAECETQGGPSGVVGKERRNPTCNSSGSRGRKAKGHETAAGEGSPPPSILGTGGKSCLTPLRLSESREGWGSTCLALCRETVAMWQVLST